MQLKNLKIVLLFISWLPIELSCIKIADFHENEFDILKSNTIWDSSELGVDNGIVIASSIGNLGQSVSKHISKNNLTIK